VSSNLRVVSTTQMLSSFVFDVERRTVSDGLVTFDRDVVTHRGAVAILAVDDEGRVGVISQYRVTINRLLVEIPAGTIDPDESDTLAVAQRELREELGVIATTWELLGRTLNSPGWTNQVMHVFLATGVTKGERSPIGPEEEQSTLDWWTVDDVRQYLRSSEPIDATTAFAFSQFLLRYER